MAHYIFNFAESRELALRLLRARLWGVDTGESHAAALAPGDHALIYLGAPERMFIGRAELGSAVHEWTALEAAENPGDSHRGVVLAQVDEWEPPVPMSAVLSRMDPSEKAKADFGAGVVRITAGEYETALAVQSLRASTTPRASTSSGG